jgi:hypothetical protein
MTQNSSARGEINDRAFVGLVGVVKVNYAIVKGMFYLNFEAFAPAGKWKELSPIAATTVQDRRSRDL